MAKQSSVRMARIEETNFFVAVVAPCLLHFAKRKGGPSSGRSVRVWFCRYSVVERCQVEAVGRVQTREEMLNWEEGYGVRNWGKL